MRRRAVIYETDGKWFLQACVVEGVTVNREIRKEASRNYARAVLFEDWLTLEELQEFIAQILQGEFSLGKYLLKTTSTHRQWTRERQPLSNYYMKYAGYVWTSKFHEPANAMNGELLSPKQPYYPDLHEAVKNWLPYPAYQGVTESRKGEVLLFLPETRAYFEDAIPNGNSVDLRIAGVEANKLSLEVKGAWWDEEGIHHFSENVHDGHTLLNVPDTASRLDYVLVDTAGAVYDFQQEDGYRHTGLGRKRKTDNDRTLLSIVREACLKGEGPTIEFKPFINPENAKIKEVIKTVVAFSNAQGGRIFFGINNGCELEGLDEELSKWAKTDAMEACNQYLGVLKAKIRDELRGDVYIDFNHTIVDGRRIAVIEIIEAKEKPVTIQQDKCLYIRRGSSTTKASPEEWRAIINTPENGILAPWMRKY